VLDWDQFQAEPQTDWTGDMHCVTRWSKFGMHWRGVSVADLLARAEPTPAASHLMAHCYGGYTTNMPLSDVTEHPAFIAHQADGAPLEGDHGGPARLLVPHLYLWKSAKWVSRLEVLTEDHLGFWEVNGYHHRGDPWREERYSVDDYVARTMRRQARSAPDRPA
jgi:DMSO/TMAO reductase YedYZ molybdopterin-dependent catalytic subunit